jgi:amidase
MTTVLDPTFASASSLARAIRTGEISSEELVEAHLRRIAEANQSLNAVVHVAGLSARADARAADARLAAGAAVGPLHGVPITIKDNHDVAGMPCTAATEGLADRIPTMDATVVARLKAAGAIVLGKTNLPELALAFETDNLVYGRTNSPYDLARTPGGSSGGEAAIIAAGGSPLGIGNDAAGSIRLPAHFCGIAGIKPTTGRVPKTGYLGSSGGALSSLMQSGPLARYVEDLELALPIICGGDGQDPAVVDMPLGDRGAVELRRLRVAFHTDNGIVSPTGETADTVRRAAMSLVQAGISVDEACPAGIERTFELFFDLFGADGGVGLQSCLKSLGTTSTHPLMQQFLELLRPRGCSTIEAFARLAAGPVSCRDVCLLAELRRDPLPDVRSCSDPAWNIVGALDQLELHHDVQPNRLAWCGGSGGDVTGRFADWRADRRSTVARRRGAGDRPTHRDGYGWLATAGGSYCTPGGMRAMPFEACRASWSTWFPRTGVQVHSPVPGQIRFAAGTSLNRRARCWTRSLAETVMTAVSPAALVRRDALLQQEHGGRRQVFEVRRARRRHWQTSSV